MKTWMNREMRSGLAWGLGILAVALVMNTLRKWGYADNETVTRVVSGMNGLMVAWNGNVLPKAFVPSACARQARRVAGWSMTLAGLVFAGLFAFAPLPVASVGGCAAVLGGITVSIGYCLALRRRGRAA